MDVPNRIPVISAESYLPDVVSQYPATRAVFDRYGLQGCGGRLGPSEQVQWFARLHGVAIDKLLAELNEAARMFQLSAWQRFWRIDVPFSLPGLLWNTMVSMSAGWFFVVASEAIS